MKFGLSGRKGESLLEAMQRAGIPVTAPCGGNGTCGKCRIEIASTDLDADIPEAGESGHSGYGYVQSCRTHFIRDGRAWALVPDSTLDIISYFSAPIPAGPPTPDSPDSASASDISDAPDKSGGLLAAAVDIGTTTVAVCLLDAKTGSILSGGAEANVQRWAGADVITRIGISGDASAFERMRDGIREQIVRMIASLAESSGRHSGEVRRIAVAGNPTMLHLWAGVDPAGIAKAPFVPVFTSSLDLPAPATQPFGESCRYLLLPGISAYVGADLVAGALACGLGGAPGNVEPTLLLDLGTNGEILLFVRDKVWCCSAAAGPAFEGASIEFGCASISGAVDHVTVTDGETGVSTLGGGKAVGICGSGLLDAVAALLSTGAIDSTGRIDPRAKGLKPEYFTEFKGKPAIVLDRASRILLTQDDIRQVQLAKAAIAAGIDTLLDEAGIAPEAVAKVFLAGGFGSRLDPRSAVGIGLFPAAFSGRIEAVGNAALAGAAIVAVRRTAIDACIGLAERCAAIELSGRADFTGRFAEAITFPEN